MDNVLVYMSVSLILSMLLLPLLAVAYRGRTAAFPSLPLDLPRGYDDRPNSDRLGSVLVSTSRYHNIRHALKIDSYAIVSY